MKPKRVHLIAFALLLAGAFWFHLKSQVVTLDPRPDSEVEMTTVENGTTYKLHQGNLYRVLPRSGKWEFVKQYYDTHFYASNVSVIPSTVDWSELVRGGVLNWGSYGCRRTNDDFEA